MNDASGCGYCAKQSAGATAAYRPNRRLIDRREASGEREHESARVSAACVRIDGARYSGETVDAHVTGPKVDAAVMCVGLTRVRTLTDGNELRGAMRKRLATTEAATMPGATELTIQSRCKRPRRRCSVQRGRRHQMGRT